MRPAPGTAAAPSRGIGRLAGPGRRDARPAPPALLLGWLPAGCGPGLLRLLRPGPVSGAAAPAAWLRVVPWLRFAAYLVPCPGWLRGGPHRIDAPGTDLDALGVAWAVRHVDPVRLRKVLNLSELVSLILPRIS